MRSPRRRTAPCSSSTPPAARSSAGSRRPAGRRTPSIAPDGTEAVVYGPDGALLVRADGRSRSLGRGNVISVTFTPFRVVQTLKDDTIRIADGATGAPLPGLVAAEPLSAVGNARGTRVLAIRPHGLVREYDARDGSSSRRRSPPRGHGRSVQSRGWEICDRRDGRPRPHLGRRHPPERAGLHEPPVRGGARPLVQPEGHLPRRRDEQRARSGLEGRTGNTCLGGDRAHERRRRPEVQPERQFSCDVEPRRVGDRLEGGHRPTDRGARGARRRGHRSVVRRVGASSPHGVARREGTPLERRRAAAPLAARAAARAARRDRPRRREARGSRREREGVRARRQDGPRACDAPRRSAYRAQRRRRSHRDRARAVRRRPKRVPGAFVSPPAAASPTSP